ncbi:hypothetical protein ACFE04_006928 [Oxalis oulophora]
MAQRIAEVVGVVVSFDPKPIPAPGDWNGAGAHTNYTYVQYQVNICIEKLKLKYKEHIAAAYGEGNERRLTGKHETADIKTFESCTEWQTVELASLGESRQGHGTEQNGKGYFEDKRPASNMDPYIVTSMIAETTILWKPSNLHH